MKPRLIISPDPFLPIALVHESAHATAAYHLRFPFSRVRILKMGFGRCVGGGLSVDQHAATVAFHMLKQKGAEFEDGFSVTLGTVLRIARRANAGLNAGAPAASEENLNWYAKGDCRDLEGYFAKYSPDRQNELSGRIDQEVERIFTLPTFSEAVDDIVPALKARRSLTSDEVCSIIEAGVGDNLRNPAREPTRDEIEALARQLSQHPAGRDQQLSHWLTAERALRLALAIHHSVAPPVQEN